MKITKAPNCGSVQNLGVFYLKKQHEKDAGKTKGRKRSESRRREGTQRRK